MFEQTNCRAMHCVKWSQVIQELSTKAGNVEEKLDKCEAVWRWLRVRRAQQQNPRKEDIDG
jgi:hypothetical protein